VDILIVEDEPEIAQLIEQTLEREGFVCSLAGDGWQALTQVENRQPDAIVLDLMEILFEPNCP